MVFQYTHHSVSGGIIKSLIVDNITNCTNLYLSYIHMVHVHVYNTFKWIGDHKITTLLIQQHVIPISQMVDFCESYSPFHVCLTIRPSAHLVYATSHLSFVAFYSYLISWLARYNMRMLRSWPINIPNMNKMRQKRNDYLHTQNVRMDVWSKKHEKGYQSCKNQPSVKSV
jgi:hypothetical protein